MSTEPLPRHRPLGYVHIYREKDDEVELYAAVPLHRHNQKLVELWLRTNHHELAKLSDPPPAA